MTPEGERRRQQFMDLIAAQGQGPATPAAEQFRTDNTLPPIAPAVDSPRSLPPSPDRQLADKWGGRSPDIPGLFQRAAAKNAGGVAHAQGAEPAASDTALPDVPADDPKGQFLRAHALRGAATGGDTERRDRLQMLQDFDTNMNISPSIVSAWSPQGMKFIEMGGSAKPSATRQAEIDEINKSDRESAKNAADIEAARVRQQSAAQTLTRPDDADTATMTGIDRTLNMIAELKEEKKTWDTGPLSMSMNKLAGMVGWDDPKKTAFRQKSHTQLVESLQETAGKSMTPTEIENAIQKMPTVYDNDETWTEKMDVVEKLLLSKRATFLEGKARQGKNMSAFAERSTAGAATVLMVDPDTGEENPVPQKNVEAALARGLKKK